MKLPIGFRFAGVAAGIRPSKPDVALFVSDRDAACAGVFTVNRAKAAPVRDAEARLPAEAMRAVLVTSGNANALTGPAGLEAVDAMLGAAARALGVARGQVASASTGVIGMRMPVDKVVAALPACAAALGPDPALAAEAIMTTDTTKKLASRTIEIDGVAVTLAGICKGSGMIAPQLATMIAVIVTDCAIEAGALQAALRAATPGTFGQLVVDGDMSTNDSVFVLANGAAGHRRLAEPDPRFVAALTDLCDELARDIASDGEGATKRLDVVVDHAPDVAIARDIARAIAASSLVKAAMFGQDANWGRILATVGARAGANGWELDVARAEVTIQGTAVYDGAPTAFDRAQLKARLREPEIAIRVDLRAGDGAGKAYGCDLSYDYVKLNADYTSVLFEAPDGGVRRDDRLGNYSPAFKRALLVQALGYISRFRGTRCVIKLGGTAMAKDGAKRAFCDDVLLLRSVGLAPIVIHDVAAGEAAGGSGNGSANGSAKMAEMLTGALNGELVTLLNRGGGHAVGLSGKDAALLRARAPGELAEVNAGFVEALLGQHYVPVIAPLGLGGNGESHPLAADEVASAIARAVRADKLIYLADVPGVLDGGDLVTDLVPHTLHERVAAGAITGGMRRKAEAALAALAAGIHAVHVIDGRIPHNLIAELFTDTGVGTIIRAGEA
ncbi:MAG TPA: bifunctional glutamate N-acetyltransferase/amino-acid acetyltransferase ArgJ [Kofleriaceae bacterium]|nr:bifunctional glutamate N-acetyltransferase/amino-acid acetyltransferase ArgJ [Kofleriaceae bacterium]